MIIGQDFRFRDDLQYDTCPVEILIPPFKDVILRFTEVSIKEEVEGTAVLRFAYEILNLGGTKLTEKKLRKNKMFTETAGLILNAMLLEAVNNEAEDENREDYIEEPNQERVLHPKGSSLSS